jgi:cell division septation protein DedD
VPEAQATPEPAGRYSVQIGALILESSVRDLEKKAAALGYETYQKEGTTTAMMNMLVVGPFPGMDEASGALSRLRESGIDSNLVRKSGGGAVINAGSYLLEANATSIEQKISSMGYPVELEKKAVKLPMTFVRVGHFNELEEATLTRDELKENGLDAIVISLE